MPRAHTEHLRSAVTFAAAEKNVPASQVELCGAQETARAVLGVEAEACEANVPAAQTVQFRSAVVVAAAEKKVPGGHEVLCTDGQAEARLAVAVDSIVLCAKVPTAHGVQTLS